MILNLFFEEENYYYIKFKEQADSFPRLLDLKDEFVNGNLISVFNERQENEDINQVEYAPGDMVNMELIGEITTMMVIQIY